MKKLIAKVKAKTTKFLERQKEKIRVFRGPSAEEVTETIADAHWDFEFDKTIRGKKELETKYLNMLAVEYALKQLGEKNQRTFNTVQYHFIRMIENDAGLEQQRKKRKMSDAEKAIFTNASMFNKHEIEEILKHKIKAFWNAYRRNRRIIDSHIKTISQETR